MTTRVYAYAVDDSTGQTTDFVGFGSLISPDLVALHPAPEPAPEPRPEPAPEPDQGWTGATSADARAARPGRPGPPMRCLVVDDGGLEVIDGRGLTDRRALLGPVTGIRLLAPSAARSEPIPWPPFPASDEANIDAYTLFLAEAGRDDPAEPPYPRPRRPPVPSPLPEPPPGKRPPWCSVWPGGPGCG